LLTRDISPELPGFLIWLRSTINEATAPVDGGKSQPKGRNPRRCYAFYA
jgi:hypothetical protein